MNTYIPNPIDTSDVRLSPELLHLTELLAANTHEVWAAGRMAEGYRFGYTRDDVNKLHPDLRPYEELTFEEQEYDRHTAMEAIRVLVKLGYRIEKM